MQLGDKSEALAANEAIVLWEKGCFLIEEGLDPFGAMDSEAWARIL